VGISPAAYEKRVQNMLFSVSGAARCVFVDVQSIHNVNNPLPVPSGDATNSPQHRHLIHSQFPLVFLFQCTLTALIVPLYSDSNNFTNFSS